ncbi:hypothetical protein [Clostridium tagluense]|uniref:Uncharacterized protein n=1 Tax=Clostridium tagluense TaxID=360422 RepID=A0A401UUL7_9CLOT|nr:hypothetical protein [Clostridium tagluense]GCD13250.1 hypothetical protein Ctaglu_48730 [Clostridium tagluense]
MEEKYLVDLRHLIDFNKLTTYIDVSDCFEYQYPTNGMDMLYSLLRYAKENLATFRFDITDKTVFYSFMNKIEDNKNMLLELNKYILFANNKLKLDKGLLEGDALKVGLPQASFVITLEELIIFYKILEKLQESYENIAKWSISEGNIGTCFRNVGTYFRNIETIKTMLEKRLMYKLTNR